MICRAVLAVVFLFAIAPLASTAGLGDNAPPTLEEFGVVDLVACAMSVRGGMPCGPP